MRVGQTDGAIAAEMLTCAIQKMIHFLKTNRAGGLTLSALIRAHAAAPWADGDGGGSDVLVMQKLSGHYVQH